MNLGSDDLLVVPGQRWNQLPVPQLGAWRAQLRVCVVLPARDCQEELDRTLAALAHQSYPPDLLDVIVVDDSSTVPLQLPRLRPGSTQLVRLEEAQSHGSGRARHEGAKRAVADVLLFLDADMVADGCHVEAHARWHHLTPHAVVLGKKWFVDFSDITPSDVGEATSAGGLSSALAGRPKARHVWQEDFIRDHQQLTHDADDCFLAVVGASVSIRRDLYVRTGGFSEFGLRGIVDTEFGYRAFTGGGLIIPDDEALAYHQGMRNFSTRGDEIKRHRTGLAANFLPIDLFRPSNAGRRWAVPMVHVIVDSRAARPEDVQVTTDSILASRFTDLVVTVVEHEESALPPWLSDYFRHDGRVRFADRALASGFPSPVSVAVSPGLSVETDTLDRVMALMEQHRVGVVRTHPDELDGRSLEVWRTRAILRSIMPPSTDLDQRACELFGERWASATSLGVHEAHFDVTRQGMIVLQRVPDRVM